MGRTLTISVVPGLDSGNFGHFWPARNVISLYDWGSTRLVETLFHELTHYAVDNGRGVQLLPHPSVAEIGHRVAAEVTKSSCLAAAGAWTGECLADPWPYSVRETIEMGWSPLLRAIPLARARRKLRRTRIVL